MAVAVILLMGIPVPAQPEVTLGQIKKSLVCQCGCNMTVDACQGAMDCQTAENLAVEASALIGQGMDRKDILDRMVSRYGERILSSPIKRGFNLTAWTLPFVTLFLATFGVLMALKRWVGLGRGTPERSLKPADPEYEQKLEEVLRDLG